jgi:FkbM family methyltransferase
MIIDRFVTLVPGFCPRTIVHIGASWAQELERYEALNVRQVVWIDAHPRVQRKLRSILGAKGSPGVRHVCVEALVADEDGRETPFHLFNNNGASSSIFHSTDLFREKFAGVEETGETVIIKSARLDTILRQESVPPNEVDILVFDVQGAELLALKGAGDYLAYTTFIEVEVSQEPLYADGVLFADLDRFLAGAGFTRVSSVRWHGDVAYVRTAALSAADFEALRLEAAIYEVDQE